MQIILPKPLFVFVNRVRYLKSVRPIRLHNAKFQNLCTIDNYFTNKTFWRGVVFRLAEVKYHLYIFTLNNYNTLKGYLNTKIPIR